MKKFTKTVAVFLFCMGVTQLVSAQSAYQVKSSSGANLRQGPATGKEVITTMPAGAKIKVVDKADDGWYKVEYNGKTGYVSAALVEEDNNPTNNNNTANNNTASNSRNTSSSSSPAAEKNNNSNSSSKNSSNSSSNKDKSSNNSKSSASNNSGSSAAYKWGIGLRLGEPTGITVKKYNGNSSAWELNLGRSSRWGYHYDANDFYKHYKFDRDDYYFTGYKPRFTTALQVRYMLSKPINGLDGLNFYYGGGLQARFTPIHYSYFYYTDNGRRVNVTDRRTDIDLGLDGVLGLEYMMKDVPLSFFLDLNVFVEIVDAPFVIYPQGGAGVRYNF